MSGLLVTWLARDSKDSSGTPFTLPGCPCPLQLVAGVRVRWHPHVLVTLVTLPFF